VGCSYHQQQTIQELVILFEYINLPLESQLTSTIVVLILDTLSVARNARDTKDALIALDVLSNGQ
jgi:hypothetical protein